MTCQVKPSENDIKDLNNVGEQSSIPIENDQIDVLFRDPFDCVQGNIPAMAIDNNTLTIV